MYNARGSTMDFTHNSFSDNFKVESPQDKECAKKAWAQPTVVKISVRNTFAGAGSFIDGFNQTCNPEACD